MVETTDLRPPEPLVALNVFREQPGSEQDIPSFLGVKEHLALPVLPDHAHWVEMYWRAWELAWSKLRRPGRGSGLVANYIDSSHNSNLLMWDSCFMVQFGLYARRLFDFMGTLDNFYAKQHGDGFVCREIDGHSGADLFHPYDPDATGPNIMAWAEWRYYRATGDDSRLARVFWPLVAFHRWFKANRSWPSGFYWATGWSSGMGNQARVPDGMHHHRHWSWADTTIQAALDCQALGMMASLLDEPSLAAELAEEHADLVRLLNSRMWNDEAGLYQDIDRVGRFSTVKSIAAFWSLLVEGLVPTHRLSFLVQNLRDSWSFGLPHPIPSQSADSDGYNPENGHYWRGAVWSPTNYMVLRGLRSRGNDALAHEIAVSHMRHVEEVYLRTDTFWENYAPEKAAPGDPARPDHVGITGLSPISILLEDVIGVSADWPRRLVTWDRRLESSGYWGVRNYPLGPDGRFDLVGNGQQAVVITDVPFGLVVHNRGETINLAVPVGTTEIDFSTH
jgi:hypothetical protein